MRVGTLCALGLGLIILASNCGGTTTPPAGRTDASVDATASSGGGAGSSGGSSGASSSGIAGSSGSGGSSSGAGACIPACQPGLACCAGKCINEGNDPTNCGGCGVACGGNTPYCAGSCQAAPCEQDAAACASGSCCGQQCCSHDQLCCQLEEGVWLTQCYTPTSSQDTCPVGCPTCQSDRNVKREIRPVDPRAVLDAVAAMPVSTWSYKRDDPSIRHMGPMAQDLYAAFGLGGTDKAYSPVDAHGLAFAAIQGLYERLDEQDARIERLERENAELRAASSGAR